MRTNESTSCFRLNHSSWTRLFCKMEHLCYNLKSQSRKYNHRKPESSAEHLDGSLFVVFGIQDLFATHCTDAWKKKKTSEQPSSTNFWFIYGNLKLKTTYGHGERAPWLRALTLPSCKLELGVQHSHILTNAQVGWRQEDPWGLLASSPTEKTEAPGPERDPSTKRRR